MSFFVVLPTGRFAHLFLLWLGGREVKRVQNARFAMLLIKIAYVAKLRKLRM